MLTILEAVSIAEMQMLVPKRIFDTFVNEVSRQLEVFILKVVDKPLPMQKFNKIDEFIRLISVERLANIWSAK